jgi:hypothetical protein
MEKSQWRRARKFYWKYSKGKYCNLQERDESEKE